MYSLYKFNEQRSSRIKQGQKSADPCRNDSMKAFDFSPSSRRVFPLFPHVGGFTGENFYAIDDPMTGKSHAQFVKFDQEGVKVKTYYRENDKQVANKISLTY